MANIVSTTEANALPRFVLPVRCTVGKETFIDIGIISAQLAFFNDCLQFACYFAMAPLC